MLIGNIMICVDCKRAEWQAQTSLHSKRCHKSALNEWDYMCISSYRDTYLK